MSEQWKAVEIDHVVIVTARAAFGAEFFTVNKTRCEFLVRYRSGAHPDIAVASRERLIELVPCLHPASINFISMPDEHEGMRQLVAEIELEQLRAPVEGDVAPKVLH